MPKPLTDVQERFVDAYRANGGDGLAACRLADRRKLGEAKLRERAAALLAAPAVKEELAAAVPATDERRMVQQADPPADAEAPKDEAVAARVLAELMTIGFANLADYVTWSSEGVTIKSSTELTPAQTAALVEIGQSREGVRLKFDKLGALTLLGRRFGIFREPVRGPHEEATERRELSAAERCRRLAFLIATTAGGEKPAAGPKQRVTRTGRPRKAK